MVPINEPKYGDIAVCQQGYKGLILEVEDDICYGIHLSRLKLGSRWQSVNPTIIGNLYDYIESLKC